ncbi:DUF1801 domain-containing protein [Candidatus Saccharibacteria bacterium]|nr:DUF1801 domain-containing protein [Candidatus Saccharibacteria bacterium]
MNPSKKIDQRIAELTDWRGQRYAELRALIHQAAPELQEDWKWDTAVWKLQTNVCAVSQFKDHVKINFFKGVELDDPDALFNSGLTSKHHRSINFAEADVVRTEELAVLIKQAALAD